MQLSVFAHICESFYMALSGETFKATPYMRGATRLYNHSGDNGVEDPPVPIPNTEVKLYCAEST